MSYGKISITSGDDFHKLDLNTVFRTLARARDEGRISDQDYLDIYNFINQKRGLSNISTARCRKIVYILTSWRRYIGEYRKNTLDDLAAGVVKLTGSPNCNGKPYSDNCIYDFIRILKTYYSWLSGEGYTTLTDRQINKIRMPKKPGSKYSERDVLSVDDIKKIISVCKTTEEKALVSLLYEGALRIGELGTLTWGQVEFRRTHVNLHVNFKTGIDRQIPIITYQEYIKAWANIRGDNPKDAPVFSNRYGKPYNYAALRKKLQCISGRCEIMFAPHLFRHSRITHMILEGMGKEVVSLICWGSLNAHELDRYAHLYGSVDSMVLAHYKITTPEDRASEPLSPTICPKCGYLNPPGKLFCMSCYSALSDAGIREYDKLAAEMSPETMQKMMAMFIQSRHK